LSEVLKMKIRPIPKPTKELLAKVNGENQFEAFDKALRTALTVSKSEIVKREARAKRRRARAKRRTH
jgi:hypothetical protein